MKDLAFLTSPDMSKAEVVTNHVVIAEYAGLNRTSVRKLIDNNISDLKELGKVSFEMTTLDDSRGQKVKIYQLNRNQAMLLITWLDNTEPVRAFKLALVKRFDELEKTIQTWAKERAVEKATTRSLTDAVQNWEHTNKYSQSNFRKLLTKCATGLPYTKVQARGDKGVPMVDLLTAEELQKYKRLKALVIPLLDLGEEYDYIKVTLEKYATKKAVNAPQQ
ncbi:Rha family transcriptional regulator [Lactococcus lactis]|uniref:Rha family transcriptional regulator n=1 Tax=Lactococcus lactis TaxID=1358 RepID=UPI00207445DA|nr:Rha family transcriptional regulator [Lactococcus lactis]MDT2861777.1 Rha family transcriptional regulator [Lactococcus lactis]MDT2870137.1 Rha family transcriptional regulator [Lactococcus lactis]MDT2891781.1 Rha family transcriptional regulator [Lactococcus lactis]MDT2913063.1 Rha family transcriptional regulator [Lactococcus lactis]